MAVYADPNTLSTSAEQLFTKNFVRGATETHPIQVTLRNDDAAINIFLGKSNVTSAGANGFKLIPGAAISFDLKSPAEIDQLYAVGASGTPVLHIFAIGPLYPNT